MRIAVVDAGQWTPFMDIARAFHGVYTEVCEFFVRVGKLFPRIRVRRDGNSSVRMYFLHLFCERQIGVYITRGTDGEKMNSRTRHFLSRDTNNPGVRLAPGYIFGAYRVVGYGDKTELKCKRFRDHFIIRIFSVRTGGMHMEIAPVWGYEYDTSCDIDAGNEDEEGRDDD